LILFGGAGLEELVLLLLSEDFWGMVVGGHRLMEVVGDKYNLLIILLQFDLLWIIELRRNNIHYQNDSGFYFLGYLYFLSKLVAAQQKVKLEVFKNNLYFCSTNYF